MCVCVRVCVHVCVLTCAYLDVRRVSLAVPPGTGHRGEGTVSVVKFPALKVEEEGGERLLWKTGKQISINQRPISKITLPMYCTSLSTIGVFI